MKGAAATPDASSHAAAGSAGEPALAAEQPPASAPAAAASMRSGFLRLWGTLMSARVLLAIAMLALHAGLYMAGRTRAVSLLGVCAVYLVLTVLVRVKGKAHGHGRRLDAQWLFTAGVDVLFFCVLQALNPEPSYTAMLVLPVLMAAVLGSRAVALGTASLAVIMLLGHAVWQATGTLLDGAGLLAQAGLLGCCLLLLALLTNQLALWLAREEKAARSNLRQAHTQTLVSNMVVQALSDGVLVVDAHNAVQTANPAALIMLGLDAPPPEGFWLDANPAWMQLMHIARLTFLDGPVDSIEISLHHEDRRSSHLQVRTQRTPPMGGGESGLCVMFMQDLREMEARLRTEKLASMGRMSAAVAHEIRNPLAAIAQANDLLAEDLPSPAHQRLTAMIAQNARRLGHIVDDVLNIARVQDQGSPAEVQTLELDAQVAAFCQEWRQQHAAGARLRVMLQAPDVRVQFDTEHLRRVLVNLLDNAARYATQQDGAIQVATHAVRHGATMLLVWSDGAPMETSVRRHLFEPFFSSESRSSGLGLFICRELCERHRATIGYERCLREKNAALAEGNEFFIHLRRVHSMHSAPHTMPPSP